MPAIIQSGCRNGQVKEQDMDRGRNTHWREMFTKFLQENLNRRDQ
jgi:hypothetical protein